ncbi:hypothetical protein DK37_24250 [Halomonas sp. SUBG004]|nr:hypothetical protein DK37_24250 [Halomonas sp. SUBG004]
MPSALPSSARGIEAAAIEEGILGCVLPAGVKQGPARQAMRQAGIPRCQRRHDHQQALRLRHESHDACA